MYRFLMHFAFGPCEVGPMVGPIRMSRILRHTRNVSASLTQYDAPVGNAASLKS